MLRRVEIIFDDETLGKTFTEMPVPEAYRERVEAARHEVIEAAVEHDEELLEKYLGGAELSFDEIQQAIRKATTSGVDRPGAVRRLLQEQGRPGPARRGDRLPAEPDGHPADPGPPPAARRHPHRALRLGHASRSRRWRSRWRPTRTSAGSPSSGCTRARSRAGSYVYNSTKDKRERIGRLLQMHANKRDEIEEVLAGDIAAAIGLKDTRTGDTLSDEDKPIILEAMKFPNPVIDVAIEPKTKADQDKLATALQKLQEEDPTFRVRTDAETGQTIIAGMGELHLEIIVDRMKREFKVEANVGKPQVAFRETVRKKVTDVEGKFIRQTRRQGPVRPRGHQARADRAGRRLHLRGQDRGRRHPPRVHQAGRGRASARRWRTACWPATRWWTSRRR